jgi:hypothetical protein
MDCGHHWKKVVGETMNKVKWITSLWIPLLFTGCVSLSTPKAPATITILPTRQMLPSPTNILTKQPLQTITQTTTSTPELLLTEQVGECRLPCWWGITPGVTTWDNAIKTLEQLKENFREIIVSEVDDYIEIDLLDDGGFVWFRRNDTGVIDEIKLSTTPSRSKEYYELMTEYGEPSDVYLFAYQHFQGDYPPATVILNYAREGILAEYEFTAKLDEIRNTITICPIPERQKIQLERKGTTLSFDEIRNFVMGISDFPMLKIEDSTSMTKHDFYLLYNDKNQTKCFETPLSLWP